MTAPDATAQVVQALLLYVLLPVWLLAGFGDWLCHRVQRIEHSTGLKESLLHALMVAELGTGVMAVLLLQVNAAVLVLLLVCCVLHEITTWWDLAYAASIRKIPAAEQWVHSLQLVLPWTGLISLAVIHREQALAIAGVGSAVPEWAFRWKEPPRPDTTVWTIVAAASLAVVVPFTNECWRGWQAGKSTTPRRGS